MDSVLTLRNRRRSIGSSRQSKAKVPAFDNQIWGPTGLDKEPPNGYSEHDAIRVRAYLEGPEGDGRRALGGY